MGSPKKVRVRARTRDSFRLPPSSRPQTSSTNKMAKGSGSKKAKKSGSNVFAPFSQRQIQEVKEAFGIMGADKDGLLSSGDIVAASTLLARPFPTVRPKACSQRPPDQSTSHRWSCFSQKRWLEVLMMTTPSL